MISFNSLSNNNANKAKDIENKEKGVSIQERDNSQVHIQTTYA